MSGSARGKRLYSLIVCGGLVSRSDKRIRVFRESIAWDLALPSGSDPPEFIFVLDYGVVLGPYWSKCGALFKQDMCAYLVASGNYQRFISIPIPTRVRIIPAIPTVKLSCIKRRIIVDFSVKSIRICTHVYQERLALFFR